MKLAGWVLIVTGTLIVIATYGLDIIRGSEEITLGPRSYTVITFGIVLAIIGIVFFKKD